MSRYPTSDIIAQGSKIHVRLRHTHSRLLADSEQRQEKGIIFAPDRYAFPMTAVMGWYLPQGLGRVTGHTQYG